MGPLEILRANQSDASSGTGRLPRRLSPAPMWGGVSARPRLIPTAASVGYHGGMGKNPNQNGRQEQARTISTSSCLLYLVLTWDAAWIILLAEEQKSSMQLVPQPCLLRNPLSSRWARWEHWISPVAGDGDCGGGPPSQGPMRGPEPAIPTVCGWQMLSPTCLDNSSHATHRAGKRPLPHVVRPFEC